MRAISTIPIMFFSSTMIEQGDLADRISSRSSDLKDWLMTMDILKVLEGVVKLMKTVSVPRKKREIFLNFS